jgi:hypothetical protein
VPALFDERVKDPPFPPEYLTVPMPDAEFPPVPPDCGLEAEPMPPLPPLAPTDDAAKFAPLNHVSPPAFPFDPVLRLDAVTAAPPVPTE